MTESKGPFQNIEKFSNRTYSNGVKGLSTVTVKSFQTRKTHSLYNA